ncbi:diamine acetyltransferase 1-like [Hemiscyllium ocellatum]|uniref:diamine acetyltransferase 1-like n=1 Tax=Hemiscyllium ocellatum TaxID=170820 RepID=UPI0029663B5A|nr:diamine acetyltransferase 1-like [Hemiscyllium ocellatum]
MGIRLPIGRIEVPVQLPLCLTMAQTSWGQRFRSHFLEDGFGEHTCYHCLIAEVANDDQIPNELWALPCDPWTGKMTYFEDFYIMELCRGLGIGSEILKRISQIAIQTWCYSMHFLVVRWNTAPIEYYTRRGTLDLSQQEGWHLFKFSKENMIKLTSEE